MSNSSLPTAWLEDDEGGRFPLAATSSLGRSSTANQYGFPHDKVSRRHVLVHAQNSGEFWIVDLGSTNGTYVNDERLLVPVRLRDGDSVNLGHGVALRFKQAAIVEGTRAQSMLASTAHDVRVEKRWILVADLEGFTQLSKDLPSAELAMQVGEWLAAATELLNRCGGRINRYTGDGFLAFWRESAEAVGWVATAAREFGRLQTRTKLPFRTALHWGEVAIGGAPSSGEESLMSDDLSMTFRLEALASQLRLPSIFSSVAAELLAGEMTLEEVPGFHTVKGFAPISGLRTLR